RKEYARPSRGWMAHGQLGKADVLPVRPGPVPVKISAPGSPPAPGLGSFGSKLEYPGSRPGTGVPKVSFASFITDVKAPPWRPKVKTCRTPGFTVKFRVSRQSSGM